jgi:spermidine synthase
MSPRSKVQPRADVHIQVEPDAKEGAFLPILLLLFVGSGCAALIYEVVWLQLLQLVIGSSAVSLGVLLGTFMGGMCLGSLLLPKFVSPKEHPLRVYALLEVGIGAIGLLALFGVPLVGQVYAAVGGGQGFTGILARAILCALCLLPPTMLMVATLPAIARWIGTTGTGVSWLGFFYGANIAGAVAGCLLAGFYLLRVFDMATATYVAVAINLVVAAIGFALAKSTPYEPAADVEAQAAASGPSRGATLVYVSIALSGLCALGSEVIWTRVLSLMLGATTYTFSIILAVFLTGLGIGSSIGSLLSRSIQHPRAALGWVQLFAALSIAWTAWMVGTSLPYWPVNPWLSTSPWFTFQLDLVRCLWALLPGSLFWGASFPLALAGVAARGQDPGRLVGVVYAANTVGAIAGALGFSMLTVPFIGTHGAQHVLIALAAISSLIAFSAAFAGTRTQNLAGSEATGGGFAWGGSLAALAALVVLLFWNVPPIPAGLVAYGRSLPTRDETGIKYLYKGEGMNASIAVSQLPSGIRNFHVSGKVEASSEPQDMRLQRMLGNIPAALHPNPKSVLIVGFGAGVTAGSFVPYSEIDKIVICEIEPLIPQRVASYFDRENFSVLRDPRVKVFYDDARHHVLTMPDKFDIITSDPIHPWVKGAATLYTREYFELVKAHLNPGGLVTQWVPLYESSPEVVKSEIATFFEAFPNGTVWANLNEGEGYDVVLLGKADDRPLDLDEAQRNLQSAGRAAALVSMQDVGFASLADLLATYAGHAADMKPWLADAQINRDRNLRLQYLAGMQNYQYLGGRIYSGMVSNRQPFGDRVIASPALREEIRQRMAGEY